MSINTDLANVSFNKNPLEVISSLGGFSGSLFLYYLSLRESADHITIRNSVVAIAVGCDERTVQRWTAKFHQMGILIKSERHGRTGNVYEFPSPY